MFSGGGCWRPIFRPSQEYIYPRATRCPIVLQNGGARPFLKICKGKGGVFAQRAHRAN